MRNIKLSHSSKSCYEECPRKYKLRYIDRIVDEKLRSPLWFGSALDEAFSALLLTKKKELTEEEQILLKKGPEKAYSDAMQKVQNNGEIHSLPKNLNADYYKSDFVPELITKKILSQLNSEYPDMKGKFFEFWEKCYANLKDRKKLSPEDLELYNYLNWTSLFEKGKLMLKAYEKDILPQIHEVFSLQKKISLKNENGDEIRGLIDFTASLVTAPEKVIIFDNKTSSKKYAADSVETSEQLATYSEAEGIPNAGYCVVIKEVFKKEPKIRTQIIENVIPEEQINKTFDKFEEICNNIAAEEFPQNFDSCYTFGKPCPYYGLCKYNNSEGLIKLPTRDEENK